MTTGTNKINVTDLTTVKDSCDISTHNSISAPADWNVSGRYAINTAVYGNGKILFFATSNTFPYDQVVSVVYTSDMVTFGTSTLATEANSGQTAANNTCIYAMGYFIHRHGNYAYGTSNKISYSTDGTSWSTATLPSTSSWNALASDGSKAVVIDSFGAHLAYSSTISGSWSSGTGPSLGGTAMLVYGNGVWLCAGYGTSTIYSSSSGIGSWTSNTVPVTISSSIFFINGRFVFSNSSSLYYSTNGTVWTRIPLSFSVSGMRMFSFNGAMYMVTSPSPGFLYSSTDFINWNRVQLSGDSAMWDNAGGSDPLGEFSSCQLGNESTVDYSPLGFIPVWRQPSLATLDFSKGTITAGNSDGNLFYIDVTATKGSVTSGPKRLYIRKTQVASPVYGISAYPGSVSLLSTADGIVFDSEYPATVDLVVYKNGIPQTGWTLTTTNTSGLTATISGSTLSITDLSASSGVATVNAIKVGEPTQTTLVSVKKNLGGGLGGIVVGSSYSAFSTSQTRVYLKFLATGYFQVKYGSGGSYANAGLWYNPPNATAPQGGNYYMMIQYTTSTGDTLTAGTNGVISTSTGNSGSQMNVDREYYLDNTVTGTHIVDLVVTIGTTSGLANAVVGTGTLRLQVP